MRIGLLNIDEMNKKRKSKLYFPNLALGKLARYHRQQGDTVEWAEPYSLFNKEEYDLLYASKVFNFTPDIDFGKYNYGILVRGGTGYNVRMNLGNDVDRLQPDYSIYGDKVPSDTAYGFLTRGCPNKCAWCVVPLKEGGVRPYMDIEEIAIEGRNKLVLMDNNILALKDYAIEQMEKSIRMGLKIDFNQAMDARLVDEDLADVMARVHWLEHNRIRFGCDTAAQVRYCERAIRMLQDRGFKGEFFLYTMLHGDMRECYERINFWREWTNHYKENGTLRVYCHAQPFRDTTKQNTPPKWQKDMALWASNRYYFGSMDFKDFEPRKGFKCIEYFNLEENLKER